MDCYKLLVASADDRGELYRENYYVFTDGMSNGYFSHNDVSSFGDLPYQNKYGFVTLSCQCERRGGRADCCQGDRARIAVGEGLRNSALLGRDASRYVADICAVTRESIGDQRLPPSGERAVATAYPTEQSFFALGQICPLHI